MMQEIFDPIHFGFSWDGKGWYTMADDAEKQALIARNACAKRLKAQGKRVVKFSLGDQLRSMGGMGTSHPHIEIWTKCYGLNWYDQ